MVLWIICGILSVVGHVKYSNDWDMEHDYLFYAINFLAGPIGLIFTLGLLIEDIKFTNRLNEFIKNRRK